MGPTTDPCALLKATLDKLIQERMRILWSKEVVFNLTTKEFEYSAIIPPLLDKVIEFTLNETQECERGVRNSRNQRTADS